MTRKIAVLVGSLRKESFSRKIAKNIEALAPKGLTFEEIDISKVGLYNQDLDGAVPAEWQELRDKIKSADAILFVTPEYNRSLPGVLKNAIDIASRPYGHSAFNGKPAASDTRLPEHAGLAAARDVPVGRRHLVQRRWRHRERRNEAIPCPVRSDIRRLDRENSSRRQVIQEPPEEVEVKTERARFTAGPSFFSLSARSGFQAQG